MEKAGLKRLSAGLREQCRDVNTVHNLWIRMSEDRKQNKQKMKNITFPKKVFMRIQNKNVQKIYIDCAGIC